MTLNEKLIEKIFLIGSIILICILILFSKYNEFSDFDTILYTLIGNQILDSENWEKLYFAHKPFFLHLTYAFFNKLEFILKEHILISLLSLFLTSVLIKKIFFSKNITINLQKIFIFYFSIMLFVGGMHGNSEFLITTYVFLVIYLILNLNITRSFLLGGLIPFIFFSNYISMSFLIPIFVKNIFNKKLYNNLHYLIFGFIVLISFYALILYFIKIDLIQYFSEIRIFLTNYSTSFQFLLYLKNNILFLLLLCIYFIFYRKKNSIENEIYFNVYLIGCLLAFFLLKRYIYHYSYYTVPIITIILLNILTNLNDKKKILIYFFIFLVLSFNILKYSYIYFFSSIELNNFKKDFADYKSKLNDNIVSIGVGHLPLYLFELKTDIKFIFNDTARVYFGDKEDDYWIKIIHENKNDLLLIDYEQVCKARKLKKTCSYLENNYFLIEKINNFHAVDIYKKIKN